MHWRFIRWRICLSFILGYGALALAIMFGKNLDKPVFILLIVVAQLLMLMCIAFAQDDGAAGSSGRS